MRKPSESTTAAITAGKPCCGDGRRGIIETPPKFRDVRQRLMRRSASHCYRDADWVCCRLIGVK
jgi:hypothetical protein